MWQNVKFKVLCATLTKKLQGLIQSYLSDKNDFWPHIHFFEDFEENLDNECCCHLLYSALNTTTTTVPNELIL